MIFTEFNNMNFSLPTENYAGKLLIFIFGGLDKPDGHRLLILKIGL